MPKEKNEPNTPVVFSPSTPDDSVPSAPELPKDLAKGIKTSRPKSKTPSADKKTSETMPGTSANSEASTKNPDDEPALIANPDTDKAVDQILSEESDELLAIEDAATEQRNAEPERPRGVTGRLKTFFRAWWKNPWARWITILVVLGGALAAGTIPQSRYFILNSIGVRSGASLVVLDQTTQLPLKNVEVTLEGQRLRTNVNGVVSFSHLKLGDHRLNIKRIAFAPRTEQVTLGWGSNPLGAFGLTATGRQYIIKLTDYLSGKPVLAAEATHNGFSALSDKNGKITLTLDKDDLDNIEVSVQGSGYRSEKLILNADSKVLNTVALVPSTKAVFVSKQTGKYDVYSMDVDGRNKKLLLGGTGRENSNIALTVSSSGAYAALVSTRDDARGKDGYLLSTLTLIDVNQGTVATIDHSEQIQLVDWIDDRIVYQAATAGASASNPARYRLISFDFKANSRSQLAAANLFNVVISAGDYVYYANSSTDPQAQLGLYKVKANGSGRQRVFDQEVWSGFRIAYNTIDLQTPNGWNTYTLSNGAVGKGSPPSVLASRLYLDSPDGSLSLWVDTRDGKSQLLTHRASDNKDTVIQSQEGLTLPIRWLNNHTVVYRVTHAGETADYVASIDGGPAKKIADVTNTFGFAQGT